MLQRFNLKPTAPLLIALALLLSGCSNVLRKPPAQPHVPALPQVARQPAPPPLCQPTCSEGLAKLLDSLQPSPTSAAQPGQPASAPSTQ